MEEFLEMRNRLLGIVGALLTVLLAGTAGYHIIEGWPFFDGFYMTVITLATVGYGETHPLSHHGRIFTVFLIMGGIGVMTYAFTTITAIVVEGQLSAVFRRRRMQKEIAKLSGHYIVCGASHAGGVICRELKSTGRKFVLIEMNPEVMEKALDRLGREGLFHIVGDATDDDILKEAGIAGAAGVFAVLATDQDNAFVVLTAKGLNPKARVVCRQVDLNVREKLFRSGADNVVNPEYIGGLRMASEMIRPAAVGFMDSMIRDRVNVSRFEELVVPAASSFVGRALEEVRGGGGNAPLLVALLDGGSGKYEINPEPTRTIKAGDSLVMVGEVTKIAELRKELEAA
ncbi:MAG: potassium channel protein [Elusimicrobiota bacterium]